MWTGYLALGGLEVGSNARAIGYSRTANCPIWWIDDEVCQGYLNSVESSGYDFANIDEAPWYDPDIPELSSKFLGLYIITMEGLSGSTRSTTVTQKVGPGGSIGQIREATREVRVRALLTAEGAAALEYGEMWLSASLAPGACGSHGAACGATDLAFFDECPPEREAGEPDEDYFARVDARRRFLHSVKCVSGPLPQEELVSQDGIHVGRIVEFTIVSEVPWVYGVPRVLDLPPTVPSVISDIAFNLLSYPSAELPDAAFEIAWEDGTGPDGARLTIPTPVSPAGGQSTHPSVVDFGTPWNGYRYWMASTPYPGGNDAFEDPCIVASNDGTTFVVPPGLTNPIDDQPGSPGAYNSDPDLVYGPDGRLWLFWRTYNPAAVGAEEKIYLSTSSNGSTWSTKTLIWQTNEATMRLLSPTFIYEDGAWTMYAVNIVPSPNTMVRVRSTGPTLSTSGWGTPALCTITSALPGGREVWHLEVREFDGVYVCLLNDCDLGASGIDGDLYMMSSTDGLAFTRGATVAIPRSGGTSPGHGQLYRGTMTVKSLGVLDVWYSGWNLGPPQVWNIFRTEITAPVSGGILVTTNYSENPSLETNAVDWDGSVVGVSGSAPGAYQTDGRVTGELAAVGVASYRNRILGNGATTAAGEADLIVEHDIDLSAAPTDSRPSFTIWAALVSVGGATGAALNSITVSAQWANGGGNVGSPVAIGTTTDPDEIAGKAWPLAQNVIPATADRVTLIVVGNVDWSSSATPAQNSDVRLYVDAAAVTVP